MQEVLIKYKKFWGKKTNGHLSSDMTTDRTENTSLLLVYALLRERFYRVVA
jgi:hypothetical protein